MKRLIFILFLFQSVFALNVKTIKDIEKYKGTTDQIFVTDFKEGGVFYPCTSLLKADGGVIVKDGNGKLWQRQYDISNGVNVWWWGAKGDGKTDDLPAIKAAQNYCMVYFQGEFSDRELYFRPTINFGDGMYRITKTLQFGGQSLSTTDALYYQWMNNEAPSFDFQQRQVIAGTIPVSIKCSQRAYIFGDFRPTELTPVISYGCYGYVYGGYDMQSAEISGLKIVGYNKMNMNIGGAGTNQVGLLLTGNDIIISNCGFYGLEIGMIHNAGYFDKLTSLQFRNCERGFYSIGSHASPALMLRADHCGTGFEIFSGASAYQMISTEQCRRGVVIRHGFNSFNGLYLEQNSGSSSDKEYQLEIGDDTGTEVDGTTIIGMTVVGVYGILLKKTAYGVDIIGSMCASTLVQTTSWNNKITFRNSWVSITTPQAGTIIQQ